MKVLFKLNGEEDYTTKDFVSLIRFKDELIYYVNSTLGWEYGNRHDFNQWLDDCGIQKSHIRSSGFKIEVMDHIPIEILNLFLKCWNEDFGNYQMVEYKVIY